MPEKIKNHSDEIKLLKKQLDEMEVKYHNAKNEIEQFQYLNSNISDVIWIFDPNEQKLLYVSHSIKNVLGYSPQEYINIPLPDTLTKDSFKLMQELISVRLPKFNETNEIVNYTDDLTYIHKDGSEVFTELISYFHKNSATEKVEIIGTARDITQRKKAENNLKKSEERYRLIVEKGPSVFWITNKKGKTIYISSNVEKIYGFTAEEIYDKGAEVWLNRIHNR